MTSDDDQIGDILSMAKLKMYACITHKKYKPI